MTTGYAVSVDARIAYDRHGVFDGRAPLVCLHGNGEDAGLFDALIPALSVRQPVIAIDSRGHGRSERGEVDLTIAGMARDVVAVLDAEGIAQAQVLGFSDGGNIAIALALAAPERVQSMILCGANLAPSGVKKRYQMPIVFLYGLMCVVAPFVKSVRATRDRYGLMVNEPHFDAAKMAAIEAPVLVMAGENDMIADAHTRQIAQTFPNASLVVIPEGDHFILTRKPAECLPHIQAFLEATCGA